MEISQDSASSVELGASVKLAASKIHNKQFQLFYSQRPACLFSSDTMDFSVQCDSFTLLEFNLIVIYLRLIARCILSNERIANPFQLFSSFVFISCLLSICMHFHGKLRTMGFLIRPLYNVASSLFLSINNVQFTE